MPQSYWLQHSTPKVCTDYFSVSVNVCMCARVQFVTVFYSYQGEQRRLSFVHLPYALCIIHLYFVLSPVPWQLKPPVILLGRYCNTASGFILSSTARNYSLNEQHTCTVLGTGLRPLQGCGGAEPGRLTSTLVGQHSTARLSMILASSGSSSSTAAFHNRTEFGTCSSAGKGQITTVSGRYCQMDKKCLPPYPHPLITNLWVLWCWDRHKARQETFWCRKRKEPSKSLKLLSVGIVT